MDAPRQHFGAVAWAARRPVFWALMAALVGYEGAFAALTFHLYPLLLERGLDTAGVVTVLAVIGPAQVAGRILIMIFMPNVPIRRVGSTIVIVFPFTALGFGAALGMMGAAEWRVPASRAVFSETPFALTL